jgi:hypothetical protein
MAVKVKIGFFFGSRLDLAQSGRRHHHKYKRDAGRLFVSRKRAMYIARESRRHLRGFDFRELIRNQRDGWMDEWTDRRTV